MTVAESAGVKKPNKKVAIVDNSIYPQVYTPVEHWGGWLDAPWTAFRAPSGRLPDWRDGFTHVILTGSEASVLEREPWVEEEVEAVRAACRLGLPVLGSCYGHQLLALALLGPAHVRRCPKPEIGWPPVRICTASRLLGGPRTIYAFSSHFDEVVGLPEGFSVLAESAGCAVQAFGVSGRPVWGVQFHPEMAVEPAREFMRGMAGLRLPSAPLYRKALDSRPRDSGAIRRIVSAFLEADPLG
jgi:GMP synthase-like glutamine amidotransferase